MILPLSARVWPSPPVRGQRSSSSQNFGLNLPIEVEKISVPYWRCTDQERYDYRATSLKSGGKGFPVFIHYGSPDVYGLPALEYPSLFKFVLHKGAVLSDLEVSHENHHHEPDWNSIDSIVKPHIASREGAGDGFQMLGLEGGEEGPAMCETCLYSNTPDKDFILDRLLGPDDPRVVIGAGDSYIVIL